MVLSILTRGVGSILMIPLVVLLVIDVYSQAELPKDGQVIDQWTFFSHLL